MSFVVAAPLRAAGVRCHQVSIYVNARRCRKGQEPRHGAVSVFRIYSASRRADSDRSADRSIAPAGDSWIVPSFVVKWPIFAAVAAEDVDLQVF